MRQSIRHNQTTRGAKVIAATRETTAPAVLTTLILSVVVLLLSGAVWTQLT